MVDCYRHAHNRQAQTYDFTVYEHFDFSTSSLYCQNCGYNITMLWNNGPARSDADSFYVKIVSS